MDNHFDVRADFDGRGPRWSTIYSDPGKNVSSAHAASVLLSASLAAVQTTAKQSTSKLTRDQEIISIPVLGPE